MIAACRHLISMKTITLISFVALFSLTSCFQVDSTITIKKDGSGNVTEITHFGEQMKNFIMRSSAGDPLGVISDKVKTRGRANRMGEGVELVSIEKINTKGKLGLNAVYKFSDINKLKYSIRGAVHDAASLVIGSYDAGKADDTGKAVTFKFKDDKLTIIQRKPDAAMANNEVTKPEGMNRQISANIKGMMGGMRITTKVKIDSGIAKTDAAHVDGNVITIRDIPIDAIIAEPDKIRALRSGNFDKAKAALKGVEGIKFEVKETVSVEMR